MRPKRPEQLFTVLGIILREQIFQAIRIKWIALHTKEQIIIIWHRHAGKALAQWEWDDLLSLILARGGFVML